MNPKKELLWGSSQIASRGGLVKLDSSRLVLQIQVVVNTVSGVL